MQISVDIYRKFFQKQEIKKKIHNGKWVLIAPAAVLKLKDFQQFFKFDNRKVFGDLSHLLLYVIYIIRSQSVELVVAIQTMSFRIILCVFCRFRFCQFKVVIFKDKILNTYLFLFLQSWVVVVFLLAVNCPSSYAPLPPCTPFLFINKMVESNNWSSDMNPYYPVKPCPYKNPRDAPLKLQFASAHGPGFLLSHAAAELGWFMKTGLPRAMRMLMGKEKFKMNSNIMKEGYHRHYTGNERVQHFGRRTNKSKSYFKKK